MRDVQAELLTTFTSTSAPSITQVEQWIAETEAEIDEKTNCSFTSETAINVVIPYDESSSFSKSKWVHGYGLRSDVGKSQIYDSVFLRKSNGLIARPILTITSLSINGAGSNTEADSWTALTENTGSGGTFTVNKQTGLLTFFSDKPTFGLLRGIKWSGTLGHSTVPALVTKIATKMVAVRVQEAKLQSQMAKGPQSITLPDMAIRNQFKETVESVKVLKMEIQADMMQLIGAYGFEFVK